MGSRRHLWRPDKDTTILTISGSLGEWPRPSARRHPRRPGSKYSRGCSMSDRIAHYNILSSVGSGAMGPVYRARDTKLGRTVAIRVVTQGMDDPAQRARALDLGSALHRAHASACRHPFRGGRAAGINLPGLRIHLGREAERRPGRPSDECPPGARSRLPAGRRAGGRPRPRTRARRPHRLGGHCHAEGTREDPGLRAIRLSS